MPGVLDPSMEQHYTGQFYQPAMPSGTVESTGTDSLEEEPPLLEGKNIICFLMARFVTNVCFQLLILAPIVVLV